ncbi:MAG: copper transporter, partial [Actinomycetia bacterium]|nr:copper transporter [Actinomycetes bacterium]
MFDIRYHVVSIVAVFLAIALGIILGSVIVDKGVLVEQQNAMVNSIRKDIDIMRSQNQELQDELDVLKSFENEVFPWVIDKRLENQKVGLMGFKGEENFETEVENLIERSGGKAYSVEINWNDDIFEKNKPYFKTYFNSKGILIPTGTFKEKIISEILKNI